MAFEQDDIRVPVDATHTLYMRRFRPSAEACDASLMPVLMVHGMMSNGRIFHGPSGKGLAPWLARQGFDVFVADLRGKGQSTPRISRSARHGQTEMIRDDVPALHACIRRLTGAPSVHWVSHSWGGVVLNSALLRAPSLIPEVATLVHFAAKRSVQVRNLHKAIEIDLMWNVVLRGVTRSVGYLPARQLHVGADNETDKTHRQIKRWAQVRPWVDSDDGFDYGAAARHTTLPPALYLSARNDPCRGHPSDVKRFRDESGPHTSCAHLLSRRTGHRHDYDHVNLLTHPDAVHDHFPLVVDWMRGPGRDWPDNH
jgi:predicted alpha/beta hydrolase